MADFTNSYDAYDNELIFEVIGGTPYITVVNRDSGTDICISVNTRDIVTLAHDIIKEFA